MPPHKQERTAAETLDIFVPLAHKLGAWGIKTELEELSFRILRPTEHMALSYMTMNQLALLSSVETTVPGGAKMSAREVRTSAYAIRRPVIRF
jgi:(p)ppGpp synthase/HD superfamily hydrolase